MENAEQKIKMFVNDEREKRNETRERKGDWGKNTTANEKLYTIGTCLSADVEILCRFM